MHVIIYPERLIETVAGVPTEGRLHELIGEILDPHPIPAATGHAVVWIGHTPNQVRPANPCATHLLAQLAGRTNPAEGIAVVCGWDPVSGASLALDEAQVNDLTHPFDHH